MSRRNTPRLPCRCSCTLMMTRMNPRGRLRRRRRAATETVDDRIRGPKSGRVQCRCSLQKPVFERIFRVLTVFSSIDMVQKGSVIFLRHQTNGAQDFGPIAGSRVPVFDLENGSTPASSSKKWVRSEPINSLNKLFKELLRRLTRWHSLKVAPAAQ